MKTILILLFIATPVFADEQAERDRAWQAASIAYAGSIFADLRTTDLLHDRCDYCQEASPVLPDRPTDTELYAIGIVVSYGIWKLCDYLRQRGARKTAIAILWVYTAVHFAAAIDNDRTAR